MEYPAGSLASHGLTVDNEDGVFFYGGAFTAPLPGATPRAGSRALTLADDSGPALSSLSNPAVLPKKMAWSAVAKSNLPQNNAPVREHKAGLPSEAPTVRAAPFAQLCAYYISGWCSYGDSCRFTHAKAGSQAVDFFQGRMQDIVSGESAGTHRSASSIATGGATGGAGAGGTARQAQDASDAFDSASSVWQASAGLLRASMLEDCVNAGLCDTIEEASAALHNAERNISANVECGICLEHVADIPGKRFGLLTSCTHAFCLECIREWRGRIDLPVATTRSCPVCRQISYYIIPSDRYIADASRKAEVNAAFHASQKAIPCKHWNFGRGDCPFGTSCFFSHRMLDGSEHVGMGRLTFLMDADGKITGSKQTYQLSQFLS